MVHKCPYCGRLCLLTEFFEHHKASHMLVLIQQNDLPPGKEGNAVIKAKIHNEGKGLPAEVSKKDVVPVKSSLSDGTGNIPSNFESDMKLINSLNAFRTKKTPDDAHSSNPATTVWPIEKDSQYGNKASVTQSRKLVGVPDSKGNEIVPALVMERDPLSDVNAQKKHSSLTNRSCYTSNIHGKVSTDPVHYGASDSSPRDITGKEAEVLYNNSRIAPPGIAEKELMSNIDLQKDKSSNKLSGDSNSSMVLSELPRAMLNTQKYPCPYCCCVYNTPSRLMLHFFAHFDVKACQYCGELFNNIGVLEIHIRTHNESSRYKPIYRCFVCMCHFLDPRTLSQHKNIGVHSVTRAWECSRCNVHFSRIISYLDHIVAHENKSLNMCHICGLIFDSAGTHSIHLRHHMIVDEKVPEVYQCHFCGLSYLEKYSVFQHIHYVHFASNPY